MKGMKAYVLNLGKLKIDINRFIVGKVEASLDNPNPQCQFIDSCSYGVLIDHPTAGKIIYDLGSNPILLTDAPSGIRQACPFFREEGEDMVSQLALCGTKPEEVEHVILSHLHWDHTGNAALFEHCDVVGPQKELEHAFCLIHGSRDMNDAFPYYAPDLMVRFKSFKGIPDEEEKYELYEGVHVINAPGHTPGMLALLLELEGGNIIFTSDASYMAENYGPPAVCTGGVLYDNRAYMHSLEVIRKYEKQYNATVLFSHDMEFFKTKMKKAPEYYA